MADAAPVCGAMSDPAQPVTVCLAGYTQKVITAHLRGSGRGKWFACTQLPGHVDDHTACDGLGHILARWPRRRGERHWAPGTCAGHGHERAEAAT